LQRAQVVGGDTLPGRKERRSGTGKLQQSRREDRPAGGSARRYANIHQLDRQNGPASTRVRMDRQNETATFNGVKSSIKIVGPSLRKDTLGCAVDNAKGLRNLCFHPFEPKVLRCVKRATIEPSCKRSWLANLEGQKETAAYRCLAAMVREASQLDDYAGKKTSFSGFYPRDTPG